METSILIPENYPFVPEDLTNLDQFDFENILALTKSDNSGSPLTPPSSDEPEPPPTFEADLGSFVTLVDLPELQTTSNIAPVNLLKRQEPTSPDHSSHSSESSSVTKSKRSKRAAPDTADVAPVLLLTDEDLLKHNSETFDEHVATVQRVRALTDAERNLVKLQRRKIKNRESAAKSRKERQTSFETVLQELQVIKAQNQQLLHENQQLRQRISAYESASKVTPSTLVDNLRQKFSLGKPMTPANAKAVGCLLIVLFAFGFFFNQSIGMNGPKIPLLETSTGLLQRFPPPPTTSENLSQSPSQFAGQPQQFARAFDQQNPHLNNEARAASSLNFDSPLPRHNEDASLAKQNAPREPSSPGGRLQFGGASRGWGGQQQPRGGRVLKNDEAMTPLHSWPAAVGAGRRLLDLSNGSQQLSENKEDEMPPRVVPGEFFGSDASGSQLHQQKPLGKLNSNVTFLMCSDVNRLIPQIPSEAENMFRGDPFLVLFVPPTDEKGQPLQNAESAVQLTCRVVDVQVAPIVPTETTIAANANDTAIDEASLSLPVSLNPSPVFSL